VFITEKYFEPAQKNYETNKIVVKHIDNTWILDLLDMIVYEKQTIKDIDIF